MTTQHIVKEQQQTCADGCRCNDKQDTVSQLMVCMMTFGGENE